MYHLKQIPSKGDIQKFLKRVLFGKHIFCPLCKSFNIISYKNRYRCRKCRSKFSFLSHTWLNNVKIPLPQFWLVLWCWTQRMPVKQTERLVSLSEKAVRHWFDLFRSNLPKDKTVLGHIVQLDEAYFGSFSKLALILGKQIGTRKLAYQILSNN